MAALVGAGTAYPLMPGYAVIPTQYAGYWWYVPDSAARAGELTYVIAPPALAAEFGGMQADQRSFQARLDRARAASAGAR